MRAGQELGREIRDDLGAYSRPAIASTVVDVAVEHAVADGIGERHVPVVARRVLRQLGLEVVQVVDQRFGNRLGAGTGANRVTATPILGSACPLSLDFMPSHCRGPSQCHRKFARS